MTDLEKIHKAGYTVFSIGRDKAARLLGITRGSARRVLERLRKGVNVPDSRPILTEKQEQSGDHWDIELPKTRICTLEQLIEQFKVDLSIWEVERWTANKWETSAKTENDEIIVEPLYQVKASFKRVNGFNLEAVRDEIDDLKASAKVKAPAVIKKRSTSTENSLELSIYDAHLGKLSWSDETGWENYDIGIAVKDYDAAVDTILSRNSYGLDEICYVVGNDIFNSDNKQGTTTKGTFVENDSRFQKVFKMGRKIVQKQIEKLRTVAPLVKVYIVPGNHDNLSCWHLGDSLECAYAAAKDVIIYNEPTSRKYYHYGCNLVMFCHGDKGKKVDYPMMMAQERPELWAATRIREVHTGHLHHESVKDVMGSKIRIIPALTPVDYYLSSNGWIGNIRGAQAFQWNKEDGLVGTIEYSIKPEVQ